MAWVKGDCWVPHLPLHPGLHPVWDVAAVEFHGHLECRLYWEDCWGEEGWQWTAVVECQGSQVVVLLEEHYRLIFCLLHWLEVSPVNPAAGRCCFQHLFI